MIFIPIKGILVFNKLEYMGSSVEQTIMTLQRFICPHFIHAVYDFAVINSFEWYIVCGMYTVYDMN